MKGERCFRPPIVQNKKIYTICIEIMNTDNIMSEKEIKSTIRQVNYCYASNRRSYNPVNLIISNIISVGDYFSKEYRNWDAKLINESIFQYYLQKEHSNIDNKPELIFLSSEAEEILEKMEENVIYVIGGMVDRNRYKGYVNDICKSYGFKSYKLPIKESGIRLNSSVVLATNHVFDILLEFGVSGNWMHALINNIPKRKIK
ncbi:tRNA methyltransferase 10 like protein A [Astathelohania contejeani]|uniref:tRNA (guanine(9)-N1)-methyltransferase n=1 Tax=Astathelohania contejeani TaxID=164912 RepID=A0ABQ7HVS8_9MICR|nr:tRNA methyltransferase 10 like protein A [Thelohania contejeani]